MLAAELHASNTFSTFIRKRVCQGIIDFAKDEKAIADAKEKWFLQEMFLFA